MTPQKIYTSRCLAYTVYPGTFRIYFHQFALLHNKTVGVLKFRAHTPYKSSIFNMKFSDIFYKSLVPSNTRSFETDRRLCNTDSVLKVSVRHFQNKIIWTTQTSAKAEINDFQNVMSTLMHFGQGRHWRGEPPRVITSRGGDTLMKV